MKKLIENYKPYFPAMFFIGGFVFDLVNLDRIDEDLVLIIQFIYLSIVGFALWGEKSITIERWFSVGWRNKAWHYRHEAIHFFLGALMSVYTIFYFKSASMWNAFFFIGGLAAIFVLNEFEKVKGLGSVLRFSLFALCSCSYFIYLVPIFWQHISFFTFMFSLMLSGIFYLCFFYLLSRYEHVTSKQLAMEVLVPGVMVHIGFFLLYVFKFLPPVPLSAEKMGVYHDIKKVSGQYELFYERPWWLFWQSGAQSFVSGPQDKIYCFASIFAPDFFKEQVSMQWFYKEKNGWKKTDSIPIQIAGGREGGFRGYTVKSRYDEGDWQVRVVTSDDREVSRIYFTVKKDPNLIQHEFKIDTF
jgi:hypothetical protein